MSRSLRADDSLAIQARGTLVFPMEVSDFSRCSPVAPGACIGYVPPMGDPARKPAPDDQELEHGDEWETEIDRRIEHVRSGRVRMIPIEEVEAELCAKYGWT